MTLDQDCHSASLRSLQANGGKSAKRALKRVSGRERRFASVHISDLFAMFASGCPPES